MARKLENLRNIGVVAHIDAGKTTVTERMLFYSGTTHRMGEVDRGTTETDFDPEEQQRGITIYSACVTFKWNDVAINLIDTPGHVDFTAEVERCLRVLDGAVVVFSAREGVEAQSETVWRQADKYGIPRIALINKMDREGADFVTAFDEIARRLDAKPVAVQLPIGSGPAHQKDPFRGMVDLVRERMLTFSSESQGADVIVSAIPEEYVQATQQWRNRLLESLYDYSDELMELALADEPIPEATLQAVLREATCHGYIQPVLCGSALNYVGIQPLLDAVEAYLPSPADVPPVEGIHPQKPAVVEHRAANPDAPFSGLVFKIVADRHGDLGYVRVYSGRLREGTRVLNPDKGKKENVPQLWHLQADRRERVPVVEAGDIVGVIGLRHCVTGDTLCDAKHPIVLEPIEFPETVISMAIEPASSAERVKLAQTLNMMKRQDPTFTARENEETGQTLISGMGELHLEVIRHRLVRDFNLEVRVHKPRVSYRETVRTAVTVEGQCHRQLGGQSLFARLQIRVEPCAGAATSVVVQRGPDFDLPPELLEASRQVLTELSEGGGTLGFPLMGVKTTILGGTVHETESNEVAFRIAAANAFQKALDQAGIVLMEPIMRLEINTPDDYLGDFVADLQQRRASIHRTQTKAKYIFIEAEAPLANLFGYSSTMRSLSQGRATATMAPSSYGPAPPEVLQGFM